MASTVSDSGERASEGPIRAVDKSQERGTRRRKKATTHRWRRELHGILALLAAAFAAVAVATFDPTLPANDQTGPVGSVGAWLGFALFRGFGHASLLFPLLGAFWGVAAFLRQAWACAGSRSPASRS